VDCLQGVRLRMDEGLKRRCSNKISRIVKIFAT
jgi:hypothetical protein